MAMSLPVFRHCSRSRNIQACISKCRLLSTHAQDNLTVNSSEVQKYDENVAYPPVKPKFPPGQWGDMDHTYAWLWHKTKEELLNIPDVKGRLDYLNSFEMTCINAIPYGDHPDYLNFASYVTKSHVMPWSQKPQIFAELESQLEETGSINLENIKQSLIDQISMESEMIVRSDSINEQKTQSKLVLRCVADTLVTHLSEECDHLRSSLYDEDVIVRTFWDRHGIERQRRVRTGAEGHFKYKTVLDQRLISTCNFDGMLRSDQPLPQFAQRDSDLSTESKEPSMDHKYFIYGVPRHTKAKLKSLLAGHILGDPCEYGLIGFVSNHNRSEDLDQQFGKETARKCRLGRGLLMTFSWLAAQAYNQGFSGLVDLTFPLTSQTVMSDGRVFSFLASQLNTLELWKSHEANRMVNLCWHTDEMPLFDRIEDGQVKGFNDDTLKMLVTMFLLQPAPRGYDLKPTIGEKDVNLHLKDDFIPFKEEAVEEEEEEEQYIV